MYWVCGITFAFCPRVLPAPALNCSLRLLFNLHSGKVPVYSVCTVWSHIVGGCQIDRFIGGLRCSFASLPPPLTSPRLHSPYHLHGSPSTTTFPPPTTAPEHRKPDRHGIYMRRGSISLVLVRLQFPDHSVRQLPRVLLRPAEG
jgi:hypothetical protein